MFRFGFALTLSLIFGLVITSALKQQIKIDEDRYLNGLIDQEMTGLDYILKHLDKQIIPDLQGE